MSFRSDGCLEHPSFGVNCFVTATQYRRYLLPFSSAPSLETENLCLSEVCTVLINCNLQVRFQNLGTVTFCPRLMVCCGRGRYAVFFDLHFNEGVILVVTLFTFMAYLALSERLNFEC